MKLSLLNMEWKLMDRLWDGAPMTLMAPFNLSAAEYSVLSAARPVNVMITETLPALASEEETAEENGEQKELERAVFLRFVQSSLPNLTDEGKKANRYMTELVMPTQTE